MEKFNSIDKGKRVWSKGYPNHGPLDGAKIDIATNIGGTIVAFSRPYSTMDFQLYEVKWDSGQTSKHYYKELQPIGTCKNWDDYEEILSTGENAKVIFGPRGGFKKFEMIIKYDGIKHLISLDSEQSSHWQEILDILKKHLINYEEEILPGKQRKT
jgi:hypothetical protein